jgi:hypothetical protein
MVAFNNRIYVPWHAKSEAAPRACGDCSRFVVVKMTMMLRTAPVEVWLPNLQLTGIPDIASAKF